MMTVVVLVIVMVLILLTMPMQAMMLAFMIGSAIAFFLNIFGFMMIHTFNANGIKGCAAALLAPSLRL